MEVRLTLGLETSPKLVYPTHPSAILRVLLVQIVDYVPWYMLERMQSAVLQVTISSGLRIDD
jgi:hypothetical protein